MVVDAGWETSGEERAQARLARVRAEIARAAARVGRDPAGVRLVAVSKGHGPERIAALAAAGVGDFGENRVQEAVAKIPLAPPGLTWHLVGRLQTNKVRAAVRTFAWIHSLDRPALAEALSREAVRQGRVVPVLVEVNVAGEATKAGVSVDEAPGLVAWVRGLPGLQVRGLMTVAPPAADPEEVRPVFRALRELLGAINAEQEGPPLTELSMGMSGDYTVAVEEGATMVRIGTALFGPRAAPQRSGGEDSHGPDGSLFEPDRL